MRIKPIIWKWLGKNWASNPMPSTSIAITAVMASLPASLPDFYGVSEYLSYAPLLSPEHSKRVIPEDELNKNSWMSFLPKCLRGLSPILLLCLSQSQTTASFQTWQWFSLLPAASFKSINLLSNEMIGFSLNGRHTAEFSPDKIKFTSAWASVTFKNKF